MLKAIKKYGEYRKTVNELRSLSDRQLNDLGISRGQIETVACGSVL